MSNIGGGQRACIGRVEMVGQVKLNIPGGGNVLHHSDNPAKCLWAAEAINLFTSKAITIMNALTSCLILINYNVFRYRHVSKTDIKCAWLKHPNSRILREMEPIRELYPHRRPVYRLLLF